MAKVQYESEVDAGQNFWTAHYDRYAIRIDANQPVSQSPGGFGWSTVRNVTGTEAGHSGG